jgi:hypothetical protein
MAMPHAKAAKAAKDINVKNALSSLRPLRPLREASIYALHLCPDIQQDRAAEAQPRFTEKKKKLKEGGSYQLRVANSTQRGEAAIKDKI